MIHKNCEKCKEKFITGDRADNLCCHCDGTFPRLKYYENYLIEKEEYQAINKSITKSNYNFKGDKK